MLHLVNYSGFPVDDITAHVLGKRSRARLLQPEGPPSCPKCGNKHMVKQMSAFAMPIM